jgi:hypothetical protein
VRFSLDTGLAVTDQLAALGAEVADLVDLTKQRLRDVVALPGALKCHEIAKRVAERGQELDGKYWSACTREDEDGTPLQPGDPANLASREFIRLNLSEFDDAAFDSLWELGVPIVVDDLIDRFKEDWTPQGFITRNGEESCSKCGHAVRKSSSLAKLTSCRQQ